MNTLFRGRRKIVSKVGLHFVEISPVKLVSGGKGTLIRKNKFKTFAMYVGNL